MDPAAACPCGLGLPHDECCGRWLSAHASHGTLGAPTAEALMRSRFTAYTLLGEADPTDDAGARTARALVAYLRATWAPETRPDEAELLPGPDRPAARFTRLAVTGSEAGGPFDAAGTVEFTALGRQPEADDPGAGQRFRLRERSRFRRESGAWLYVDGEVDGGGAD